MARVIFLIFTTALQLANANNSTYDTKPHLNAQRRTELVDQAFLEQKDVLLEMLENKLKEVQTKKKKVGNGHSDDVYNKCDPVPDGQLKIKASGINAVGEVDLRMKFGSPDGKNDLKLDAVGISNIGKSHVELDAKDGNIRIPGLYDLFTGNVSCTKITEKPETPTEITTAHHSSTQILLDNDILSRRSAGLNNTSSISNATSINATDTSIISNATSSNATTLTEITSSSPASTVSLAV